MRWAVVTLLSLCSWLAIYTATPSFAQNLSVPSQPLEVQNYYWQQGWDVSPEQMAGLIASGQVEIPKGVLAEMLTDFYSSKPAFSPMQFPQLNNPTYSSVNPVFNPSNPVYSPTYLGAGIGISQMKISKDTIAIVNSSLLAQFSFNFVIGEVVRIVELQSNEFRTLECMSSCTIGAKIYYDTTNQGSPQRTVDAKGGEIYRVQYTTENGWEVAKVSAVRYALTEIE